MVVRHVSVRVGRLACVSCGGVVSLVSGVARNGKVGACSEGWRALAVRFVRVGELCGVSRAGWGGWSDGGVTPLRGCVSGGDWADVVGVWRGCQGWGVELVFSLRSGRSGALFYRLEGVRVWRM